MKTLQRAGLEVGGGFIVGPDSDPEDIFARRFEFIQRAGVVTAVVGLLTALPRTALYRRLAGEGRILADASGDHTHAELELRHALDRDSMIAGYRDLMRKLYAPANYYPRVRAFLPCFEPRGPSRRLGPVRRERVHRVAMDARHSQLRTRAHRALFWSPLLARPRKRHKAVDLAIIDHHFRGVARCR